MKTTILTFIAAFSIFSQAHAILTFSVDAVTKTSITISITNGSTLTGPVPSNTEESLFISSSTGSNFVVATEFGLGTPTGTIGTASGAPSGLRTLNDYNNIGDILVMAFNADLVAGSITSGVTNTWTSNDLDFDALPGDTNPTDVGANLTLMWGRNGLEPGTTQSTGAIPEPATYAAFCGFLALGLTVWFRRRKA